ncbi:MAG: VTT domain-containing protein [Parcubacteria group bacterium]
MKKKGNTTKYIIFAMWVVFLLVSLYFYLFHRDILESKIDSIMMGSSMFIAYGVFLVASALRGLTLIPVTYFIVVGILIFPPWPLYIMTLLGVLASSACIYYFSEYLNLDEYFEEKHPKQIKKIKAILTKNELLIVLGWSIFPFLPTDVICYVCGSLEVDIKKLLIGVLVGEGIACAGYIFLGKELLSYIS